MRYIQHIAIYKKAQYIDKLYTVSKN